MISYDGLTLIIIAVMFVSLVQYLLLGTGRRTGRTNRH